MKNSFKKLMILTMATTMLSGVSTYASTEPAAPPTVKQVKVVPTGCMGCWETTEDKIKAAVATVAGGGEALLTEIKTLGPILHAGVADLNEALAFLQKFAPAIAALDPGAGPALTKLANGIQATSAITGALANTVSSTTPDQAATALLNVATTVKAVTSGTTPPAAAS